MPEVETLTADELERLRNTKYDTRTQAGRDMLGALARIAELNGIIAWLLGERGDFPCRDEGAGLYWWRKELRKRLEASNESKIEDIQPLSADGPLSGMEFDVPKLLNDTRALSQRCCGVGNEPSYGTLAATLDMLRATIAADREKLARALDALRDLRDEQNGPPLELPRHKASWQTAMDNADAVLNELEVQNEVE